MSLPIVGAHFRPPAKALLSILPSGTPLVARPEPENPYDANAIAVWLASANIPHTADEALAEAAAGYGFTVESIREVAEWHLGYIPAKIAVALAPQMAGAEASGTLVFDLTGKPRVSLPAFGEDNSA